MNKFIKEDAEIRDYYRDKDIVSKYMRRRFATPLGRVYHNREVKIINNLIKKYRIKKILELAPGPARITKTIKNIDRGIAIDSSGEMLNLAKRLVNDKRWKFIKGDIFKINLKEKNFDLVYSTRFIFHFPLEKRKKIYAKVKTFLRKGGYLIHDIPAYNLGIKLRQKKPEEYIMYSDLWKKEDFIKEMNQAGFSVLEMREVINQYSLQRIFSWLTYLKLDSLGIALISFLERFKSDNPLEWIAICQKNEKA